MTRSTTTKTALSLSILVFAALACRLLSPLGDEQAEKDPQPEASATIPTHEAPLAGTACHNVYFPVVNGATWTYLSTGSFAGEYSFTDTITEVSDTGFTITSEFDQLTRTQEWACKPEGLLSLQLDNGTTAGITTEEVQLDFSTTNASGITLPAEISPGDQWDYSLEIQGNVTVADLHADAQGTASYSFTALKEESITVPAGTFDAMKVEAEVTIDVRVVVSGISTPVTFTSTSTQWLAPDVGLVKTVSSGDIEGTPYQETIELQTYQIP